VERAKGLLQQRFSWSEEQAYLYLRQNSRIRRVPLAELAQEVISIAASVEGSKDAAA
jgi:AmiR/NasT family two-component response regulator